MESVLADITVIDFSHVLAGPYCTMMLGDLGATVLKIEHPEHGDDTRAFAPPTIGGESAYYLGLNRNKQSITLDIKTSEGYRQILDLLQSAEVLVENFRPGTMERLGLGYHFLHEINSGLIYCSISGYGQEGPRSSQPGYDLIAQAESGLMVITGETDGEPTHVGVPVVDATAGTLAALSILAALRVRDQTGQGQWIDISLQDAALSLLTNVASSYLVSGDEAIRYGQGHPTIVPYQVFATANGHLAVACGSDRLFVFLCNDEDTEITWEKGQHTATTIETRVQNERERSGSADEAPQGHRHCDGDG